ncbi:MAG TPA: isoprenyl transferase [Lentimicrobium sp.]|nr:isoprenyl transferase [Lentimicrobium sp.]
MELKSKIDTTRLPQHIAIIMDGNGRWAKKKGEARVFGHQHGVESVRHIATISADLGIKYLTLYAFSTENWKRPQYEVDALMDLLVHTLSEELDTLMKNNIRLKAIGDLSGLNPDCYKQLVQTMDQTSGNKRMDLILALNYSGRWEMAEATKKIAIEVAAGNINPDSITSETINQYLTTKGIPDPELLIRTGGENRVSNFLLWQIAYAELYFTKVFWPDFREDNLYEAIINYQNRERRFGMISEQINQAFDK